MNLIGSLFQTLVPFLGIPSAVLYCDDQHIWAAIPVIYNVREFSNGSGTNILRGCSVIFRIVTDQSYGVANSDREPVAKTNRFALVVMPRSPNIQFGFQ